MAAITQASSSGPDQMMSGLLQMDQPTRALAVQRLQAGLGNGAVGALLEASRGRATIQRAGDDPGDDTAVPLDTSSAGGGGGATEVVGPPVISNYSLNAADLADVASIVAGRDEAGHVGWSEDMSASGTPGKGMDTVSVKVDIALQMPSWDPPATMLPKARAEWDRWYAALSAHEQGHIDLVHQVHDGLAAKILGKSKPASDALWAAAQASLKSRSKAYDVTTGHGLKTGTILNTALEAAELAEEQKKKDAAAKGASSTSAAPDAPVAD